MTEALQKESRLSPRQSLMVGVALFSMFFGAGNLILPPLLGLRAGDQCVPAMLGFLVTAIGLPVLGIMTVALAGTARELAGRVHPRFASIFVGAVYLSIGPCLAIPRTATTAFEMITPLLPAGVSVSAALLVFSVAFFAAAYALAMHPSSVTALLGRVTGPALIALIVLVVASAVVEPSGAVVAAQAPYDGNAAIQGALTGYQSMDLLASLTFGLVIADNIRNLGVGEPSHVAREVSRAGVVAGIVMALIYCGLAWVGASLGTVMPDAANGAAILAASASMHFGFAGTVLTAVIFLLACLNVCIGLITCCGTYFAENYGAESGRSGVAGKTGVSGKTGGFFGKLAYRHWALAFAVFSCAASNFGLNAILAFSVPLLGALYPMAIVLVALGLFRRACDANPQVWPWAVGVTGAVSIVCALRDALAPALWLPIDALPLAGDGLGWVLPAIIGVVAGFAHVRVARVRS